ncbi:PDR/VanB family oxidoreductase [Nocardia sp. alder85J]|uniref:PDR/VanB family oxidoreductase n=1 Tax=Nocardia sp. alder85J TaxID=2862949 RepID=UPI001CD2D1D1|nr:PDR/VanB family oxidoreductase [Nocardia sp. alder85J]MCX4095646.1 PDR/VanB family oxidoreductase [Nocardia sp. alder85J]
MQSSQAVQEDPAAGFGTEYEIDLVVTTRDDTTEDVSVLELRDPQGNELPSWEPGAHVDLILGDELVRQYSLCGDPADRSVWRVAVLREPASRGGSIAVHENLHPGRTVRIRGPRNHFELVPAPRYLLIAGGIGITPILAMVRELDRSGADWQLFYGGRRRATMAFLAELEQYGSRVTVQPQDESGILDLDSILGTPQPETLIYCCGPENLLTAVEQRCDFWPGDVLHLERFTAKPLTEPIRSDSFEIHLEQSNLTLTVPPGKSILQVVEAAGLDALSSCEEGVCGTCETVVLEGEPDHRDSILSDAEKARNDCMMICVSRSRGPRLVLDL